MKIRLAPVASCALWLGCSPAPAPSTAHVAAPSPTTSNAPSTPLPPPEWFVSSASHWVESTDGGIYRGVAGTRFEARGRRLINVADKPNPVEDAQVAPPWAITAAAPCKYIFWHERDLYGSAEWLGEPRQIATLSAPVQGSFDWFDGVGIATPTGMFVVHATTCVLDKLDLPNAATAFAASSNRAIVLTALGHARITVDGGKTFRDLSAELPNAGSIERFQEDLHVSTGTDELFIVNSQGTVASGKLVEEHPPNEPEPDPEDRWPAEHDLTSPLEAAVTNGVLLPGGDAIATDDGLVARINLATGRATEILRYGAEGESCQPVAVMDRTLVVCEAGRRASVMDAGSGIVERSFDIEQDYVWDRFVVADGEALGFVGSCAGRNPSPPVDIVTGASTTNTSAQRSPTFCVRTPSGTWVEHQLDAADATDVMAWIPRSDGGATALITLPGTFVHGPAPVEVRSLLRIVRIARNAPPINISTYSSESPKLVSRTLHSLPDGSIEGWLSSGHSPAGQMAVLIDAEGHARQRPLPARHSALMTAGRFAIVRTEDSNYFESKDFGRSFQPIDPPPGRQADPVSVSAVGTHLGPFLRIGWGSNVKPLPPPEPPPAEPFSTQAKRIPPAVRLGCRFSGPPVSARMSDALGLGLSKTTPAQMSPGRITLAGAFYVPWRGLPNALAGNAEFVYMPLLDLAAPLRRATVPLSKLDSEERISHEVRLGFVLDGATVWPVAAERFGRCPAPLVDEAGLTMPLGACIEDPTTGIVIDGRIFLIHPDVTPYITNPWGKLIISTADLSTDRSGKTKPRGTNLKTLATHYLSGGIQRYKFAAGQRGKTPVVVAIDAAGNATLAPIDPTRGTVGLEEPLASLSKLQLGNDARCSDSPDDVRVLFPFTNELGLQTQGLPGIRDTEFGGLAILRWSKQRVCLDAIDMTVHDERYEADLAIHISQGPIRKIVARFDKQNLGKGTLAVITYGTEVRQPVVCEGVSP